MRRSMTCFISVVIGLLACSSMLNAQGMGPMPDPADLASYVTGWTPSEGLFKYYTDETTKRVLLSVRPDQVDKVFFSSTALNRGTGDMMLTAPMMWARTAFEFRREGSFIEVVAPNYQFTTVMNEPMAGAVEAGFSDTILTRVMIEAEDMTTGELGIDLSSVLLALTGTGMNPSNLMLGNMGIDPMGSWVEQIKGFPKNDEIDVRALVIGATDPYGNPMLGEARIGIHFSLSVPPDPGYRPRLADDRVGYFVELSMNYSAQTDREETRYIRYVNRWRLQKADPTAEVSRPVEPIVFWLENTIPVEYRDAVREGILMWNVAFERAGFRNAIEVRQQPDDADWDPADSRYHTIRWFTSPASQYAIGPSLTDPVTGEIYDADIGVSADMIRSPFRELEFTAGPLADALAMIAPPGWPNLNGRQVRWDENTIQLLKDRISSGRAQGMDNFQIVHAFEAGRAALVLQERGEMTSGSPEEARFVHDYIVSLIGHEVGHTLGLRHNFAGSAGTPYWNLNQKFWTVQHGLSQSIMDYTITNIVPRGEHQGEYFQTTLGDYDYWAIEYAYKPVDTPTMLEETPALDEIASRAPAYRYGSDEDAYGWSLNPDPDCNYWDLSDDPVRWASDQIQVSRQLLDGILTHWDQPGTRPSKIQMAFFYAIYHYQFASMNVPRLIGGIRIYRDHVGDIDAHPAMVPVSTEDQRRALIFLRDKLWNSETFQVDPELLNMLGREHREVFDYYSMFTGIRDFDLNGSVLSIQSMPFYWIYDPVVLQRVLNNESRMPGSEEPLTLVELFDTVRNSIWTELSSEISIDTYRRNLQRAHLDIIMGIVLDPANGTPEDAVTLARHDLTVLKGSINALLNGPGKSSLDEITIAHLEETLSRINLTLSAPMKRGGDEISLMMLY